MKVLKIIEEGYNIPNSGWVIYDDRGKFAKKGFLHYCCRLIPTDLWTDMVEEAEIYTSEDEAYRDRNTIYAYYKDVYGKYKEDLYIKKVEANSEEELNSYLPNLLHYYRQFVCDGMSLDSALGTSMFDSALYDEYDYKAKKPVPNFLISCISDSGGVVQWLKNICNQLDKLGKTDINTAEGKAVVKCVENLIQSFNCFYSSLVKIPNDNIRAICQLLQSMR